MAAGPITVADLARLADGQVGRPDAADHPITGVAAVVEATAADVTFLGNPRYVAALRESRAGAAFVPEDFTEDVPPTPIRVANPSLAFAKAVALFAPPPVHFAPGIHPTAVVGEGVAIGEAAVVQPYAVIEPGASIGPRTIIGAHSYIGHGTRVGAECHIYPLVVVREACEIGDRVIIHSGTVIGSDGFGYEQVGGKHVKIPQAGRVQIDDEVEIGANVTIDRARFGRTWIQAGTKIDNLVQIGHNVTIGKHCIVVAQVGISGSVILRNYVTLAGQVGLIGHIELGDGVVVGAQSGVAKSIPAGQHWFGSPAVPGRDFKRNWAVLRHLEQLQHRVRHLEQVLGSKQESLPT